MVVDLTKIWWLVQYRWVKSPLAELCPIIRWALTFPRMPRSQGQTSLDHYPVLAWYEHLLVRSPRSPNLERQQVKARPLPKAEVTICAFRCSAAALGRKEQHQCTDIDVAWFPGGKWGGCGLLVYCSFSKCSSVPGSLSPGQLQVFVQRVLQNSSWILQSSKKVSDSLQHWRLRVFLGSWELSWCCSRV